MIKDLFMSFDYTDKVIFVFVLMVLLHIISDYLVQNEFMAKYKQKINWKSCIDEDKKYRYDYVVVLLIHSLSWSIITFFPILFLYKSMPIYLTLVICNYLVHSIIDNMKANLLCINLITDQVLHLLQIITTLLLVVWY